MRTGDHDGYIMDKGNNLLSQHAERRHGRENDRSCRDGALVTERSAIKLKKNQPTSQLSLHHQSLTAW